MQEISLDVNLVRDFDLRSEGIAQSDLLLICQFGIKSWDGKEFERNSLLQRGFWIVNKDKSMIFKPQYRMRTAHQFRCHDVFRCAMRTLVKFINPKKDSFQVI